jgi:hypothetical protein
MQVKILERPDTKTWLCALRREQLSVVVKDGLRRQRSNTYRKQKRQN